MGSNIEIKSAVDRLVEVYEKRPQTALSSVSASGEINEGLTCRITDGAHAVDADLPEIMGGADAGPTPGFYARAGVIGCVAIGLKMMAARAGHDFRSIKVDIETDFDDRATYGLCNATAAPLETRLTIEIDSDLAEPDLKAFVEDVLSRDTWFLALRDAQAVKTEITAGATA